jgi:PEP-CTERM motif
MFAAQKIAGRKFCWLSLGALFVARSVGAQGTFVYDQQSAVEGITAESGGIIQSNRPIGQSFIPTLAAIDFVRFQFADGNSINGLGATVYVNLRSNSITGPIMASTDPVFMPNGFGVGNSAGYTNFFFSLSVALTPGTTYYLQPILDSGDQSWVVTAGLFPYSRGTAFFKGAAGSFDLWFREGIVVPEPSSATLVLLGSGILFYVRRAKKQR